MTLSDPTGLSPLVRDRGPGTPARNKPGNHAAPTPEPKTSRADYERDRENRSAQAFSARKHAEYLARKAAEAKAAESARLAATKKDTRYCEQHHGFDLGCGVHDVMHKTSIILGGVALVADAAAGVCALSTPLTTMAGVACTGGAAGVGTVAGAGGATLDLLDMAVGGIEPNSTDITLDAMSYVTIGAGSWLKWVRRLPDAVEAGTRHARLEKRALDDQLDGAVSLGVSAPFDVGSFLKGLTGWDE